MPKHPVAVYITLLALVLGIAGNAIADDEVFQLSSEHERAVFSMAEAFADCAGASYFAAEFMQKAGKPNLATASRETGHGWSLSGAWMAHTVGAIKDRKKAQAFTDERANMAKTGWLARLEATNNDAEFGQVIEEINAKMVGCEDDFGEYRNELVKELRRAIYQSSTE